MITIKRGGSTLHSIALDSQAILTQKFMADDKVNLTFVTDDVFAIAIGDYIEIAGVKYSVNRLPTVKKISEVQFSYSIEFESPIYTLLDKLYLLPTSMETDFPLFDTLEGFIDVLLTNINSIDSGWTKGTIKDTDPKMVVFTNRTCRDVLNLLVDEFFVEYSVFNKVITVDTKIEYRATPLPLFVHGVNSGLYELTRESVDDGNTVTRVYGYGSDRNIPYSYRNGAKRLMFDSGAVHYLENVSNYPKYVEKAIIFEDIFPSLQAMVTGYDSGTLTIVSLDIAFDLNLQMVQEGNARVVFLTGDLMGNEFEVASYNHSMRAIKINVSTQSGESLPNLNYFPQAGDMFTLVNLVMPTAYITEAETVLKEMTQLWLDYFCELRIKYTLVLDYRYLRDNAVSVNVGDVIQITDSDLGISAVELRVTGLTKNLSETDVKVEISNYKNARVENALNKRVPAIVQYLRDLYRAGDTNITDINNILDQINAYNKLVYGTVTWSGVAYIYDVSDLGFYIQGVWGETLATQVDLGASDPTYDRIDTIYVNSSKVVGFVNGTPALNPLKNMLDPFTYLELALVIVKAGSTQPEISTEIIFDEGAVGEWARTSVLDPNVSISWTDTDDPKSGTINAEIVHDGTGTDFWLLQSNYRYPKTEGANHYSRQLSSLQEATILDFFPDHKSDVTVGNTRTITYYTLEKDVPATEESYLSAHHAIYGSRTMLVDHFTSEDFRITNPTGSFQATIKGWFKNRSSSFWSASWDIAVFATKHVVTYARITVPAFTAVNTRAIFTRFEPLKWVDAVFSFWYKLSVSMNSADGGNSKMRFDMLSGGSAIGGLTFDPMNLPADTWIQKTIKATEMFPTAVLFDGVRLSMMDYFPAGIIVNIDRVEMQVMKASSILQLSGVTAGVYGSGTQVPVVTVNEQGVVTDITLENVPGQKLSKSITVELPTATENIVVYCAKADLTVNSIVAVIRGTVGASLTFDPYFVDDLESGTPSPFFSSPVVVTNQGRGVSYETFINEVILAGDYVVFKTTASGGTLQQAHVTFNFTVN